IPPRAITRIASPTTISTSDSPPSRPNHRPPSRLAPARPIRRRIVCTRYRWYAPRIIADVIRATGWPPPWKNTSTVTQRNRSSCVRFASFVQSGAYPGCPPPPPPPPPPAPRPLHRPAGQQQILLPRRRRDRLVVQQDAVAVRPVRRRKHRRRLGGDGAELVPPVRPVRLCLPPRADGLQLLGRQRRRHRHPAALTRYAQHREKGARHQQDHRRQQRQRHQHFNDVEAGVPPPEESHPRQAPLPFHFYPAPGSSRRCWKGLFARRGRSGVRAGRAGEEAEGGPEKAPETGD